MIHRVVLGSIERFIGVITEHFAGAFPTWLAIGQVRIMPMTDRNIPCAKEVMQQLTDKGFRVTMDDRNEKIGYKIREAQVHKVPYMIVIGDKDEERVLSRFVPARPARPPLWRPASLSRSSRMRLRIS